MSVSTGHGTEVQAKPPTRAGFWPRSAICRWHEPLLRFVISLVTMGEWTPALSPPLEELPRTLSEYSS